LFQFTVIGPTGQTESTYTIPGGMSALLAEMAAMHAPNRVIGWVRHNGDRRDLSWTYGRGDYRHTVRVTRKEK
jgi:hypothetical protein